MWITSFYSLFWFVIWCRHNLSWCVFKGILFSQGASICVSTLSPLLKDRPRTRATMGPASDNINCCWCLARPVSSAFKMVLLTLGSPSTPNPSSWQLIHLETADGGGAVLSVGVVSQQHSCAVGNRQWLCWLGFMALWSRLCPGWPYCARGPPV